MRRRPLLPPHAGNLSPARVTPRRARGTYSDPVTWLAIVLALGSAAAAGLSTSVQHHAAENAPRGRGVLGLMKHLAGRPWWLFGQALGLVTVAFHAAALHYGPLALVQPIVITGIVFAVPIRAALSRTLPPWAEMQWVVVTAVGLAIFLVASAPQESQVASRERLQIMLTAIVALVAYVGIFASRRITNGQYKAFTLGAAAGLLFGLVAVTLKVAVHDLATDGLSGMATSWATYALVIVGLSGVATNQLAYHEARLSASMPVLNIVDVLLALAFGYVVFQEVPRHTPLALAAQLVSLGAILVGLWKLAFFEEIHQNEEQATEASASDQRAG